MVPTSGNKREIQIQFIRSFSMYHFTFRKDSATLNYHFPIDHIHYMNSKISPKSQNGLKNIAQIDRKIKI